MPLFGPTTGDLKPAPDNAFILQATGDARIGHLGLRFLELSTGPKSTTITFRATETGGEPPQPPVIKLTFERSFPYPSGHSSLWGLASDGTNLYAFSDSNTLLVLDPVNGNVRVSFPGPGSISNTALTFDGTNLISANFLDSTIFVISPTNGSLVRSFTTVPKNIQGLGFDGTSLYAGDNDSKQIFVIDPADGRVVRTFSPPDSDQRLALEFNGTYVVDAGDRFLNFLDPTDGSVVKSFNLPDLLGVSAAFVRGIGYAGDLAFLADENSKTVFVFRDASAVAAAQLMPSSAAGSQGEETPSGVVPTSGRPPGEREPAS